MLSIDFDLAYRQAENIGLCADEMLQQYNRLLTIIAEVRAAWSGKTASMYIKKLETVGERLQNSIRQCYDGAKDFRARIDAVKEAEENASNIIEENS